ncbi:MAG: DUF6056 family protein [Clostridia bacterium]|nr:DUF6056 family protein [Clostridia bacterium]
MTAFEWLLAAFAVIVLGALLLHKLAGLSRVFCCALFLALCACAVAVGAVGRWMPQAYRPVMRIEALREEEGAEKTGGVIWLRNAFSAVGNHSTSTFPRVISGAWAFDEDGLQWQTEPEIGTQTDVIEVSLPAAEGYTLFFFGNRQTGKVLLSYPDTGESEVVDTWRDSSEWERIFVNIGLNGADTLGRMRRDMAIAFAGCAAVSAALFALLYPLLRRHRKMLGDAWRGLLQAFERKLIQSPLARAPLNSRRWGWGLLVLFVLLLLPLLVIAVYAHPTYDDYTFGLHTKRAWQQTGSLYAVLGAAAVTVRNFFYGFQGSFASTFLMALQPGVFGERFYILGPYILIGGLVAATWLFMRTVIGKQQGAALCWLVLFFSVQFLPGADEGFFWFNGGVYYTFFYSLSLVLYSMALRAHRAVTPVKRAAIVGGACVLAIAVGGGNYVTALLSVVLLVLHTGYRCMSKDRRWWISFAIFLCLVGSFLVSATAPGNAVRQAKAQGMPYPEAIYLSFHNAFTFFSGGMRAEALQGAGGMRLEYVLGALIALPFVYRAAERNACSFRYPGLVTLLSICVYACQFTPHLAALSKEGPSRLTNIIFYTNFWMIGGNMFYWCGWWAKKKSVTEATRVLARWVAVGAAVMLMLTCTVTALRRPDAISGVSAAVNLADGRARRYGEALAERIAVFEDETVRDAVVPPLPAKPYVLKWTGMVTDTTDWMNAITANYYGKDSVSVEPQD